MREDIRQLIENMGEIKAPMTVTDQLNYMRAISYLEGYLDADKNNAFRRDSITRSYQQLLDNLKEFRKAHEQYSQEVRKSKGGQAQGPRLLPD